MLLIAILLVGGNACLAQTQTPLPPDKIVRLFPTRYKCLDLLELERLEVDPRTNTVRHNNPTEQQLAIDYIAAIAWLHGFFTAVNRTEPGGDATKRTINPSQMMAWIFSYCRTHPSANLLDAALELLEAFRRDSTTGR